MAEGERAGNGGGAGPGRPPSSADIERAEELKARANEFFKGKDYENAVKLYSSAIELNPCNAIYYGNRSLAYLRTECYGYALADATRALQLDSKYVKGYYRRAASNMALGKFKAALRDYEMVVKVRPNDKDAKLKYQECHRIVKQKAFERAIASDEHKRSVVDSLDIESMSETPGGPWGAQGIFNGDFVDRGSFSVEVILTLFGFKLLYPDHFHLLRGNHETDNMNQIYGFEGEVKAKYTAQMFALFSEVFEWLPLAQCINGKVLIMHGGLFSEDGVTLDDIRKIERNRQPPDSGPMCDLLWSDPQPQVSSQVSPNVPCSDQMGNKGSYIHLRGSDLRPDFHQFTAVVSLGALGPPKSALGPPKSHPGT
ncbi:serine/threonine-protein phosphatase 5, partial [Onychostruthus taczanowskii]|uniref:serine/threonine-protein phosphatase 5 n=1 Tax=Onychostruthus taczanowskii TaxID=356909 RepID=UPI001B8057F5